MLRPKFRSFLSKSPCIQASKQTLNAQIRSAYSRDLRRGRQNENRKDELGSSLLKHKNLATRQKPARRTVVTMHEEEEGLRQTM